MSVSRAIKDGKLAKSINFRALQIYKEMYGDLRVLPDFVIRTTKHQRVPAYFNGFKLGKYVSTLREWYKVDKSVFNEEDLKQVVDMGLVWQLQDPKVELARLTFKVYKQLHGNCEVPLGFVVPSDDNWPHITWGVQLGEILHGIRSEGTYKSIHNELKEIGVNFSVQSSDKSRFDRVFEGFQAYKRAFGDLEIPRKFVVTPEDEGFPKDTIGLQLGYELYSIRKGRFSEHLDALTELGVTGIKTHEEDDKFDKVLESLEAYKSSNGNLLVPENYVVPNDAPQNAGMKLGKIVKSIRKTGRFAQFRDKLEEIGFVFPDSGSPRK